MNKSKYTAVELFSGAGGVTEAIKDKFDLKCAVEYDPIIAKTYELNHGKDHLIVDNINNLDPRKILAFTRLKPGELDLLAVTSPCQGFSRHSRKKAAGNKDKRNKLIMQTIRYSNIFEPSYIFFENVSNIVNFTQFSRFIRILTNLDRNGYKRFSKWPSYHIRFERINASDYNVPQNRNRLILIAKRIDSFPNKDAVITYEKGNIPSVEKPHDIWPKKQKSLSLGQYLIKYNLTKIEPGETCKIDSLHKARNLSDLNKKRISYTPQNGGSRDDWPEELQLDCHKKKGVSYGDVYGRMNYNDYAPTITTGCTSYSKGRFGHPIYNRAISLREAALIQTFPKSYKFTGNINGDINMGSIDILSTQIGNAVPVNLAKTFITEITRELNSKVTESEPNLVYS
ncbi:DNA cytosine methyltransferase [Virgibacillus siamensis]|uniref:DNA cytosine methyltransferase n=1 Tax=Virgibacillus siamensis TaxID=480071 RepID=UPI0015891D17|nr:DNA cytosine methyltransferase [Virgibacillus siamensis]